MMSEPACSMYSLASGSTVGGSFVVTAALSLGRSAMSEAMSVSVSRRLARCSSTSVLRLEQAPLEIGLRFPRHPQRDEEGTHGNGQNGNGGTGQEDPILERGERFHV